MRTTYSNWVKRWQAALDACQRMGGDSRELVIAPPVSLTEVATVEQRLGIALPVSFCVVVTEFTSGVDMSWFLDEKVELPHELREIFSGECTWGLTRLVEAEESRRLWVEKCFTNPDDSYDRVWHHKLGFMMVANGDVIAFDLNDLSEAPVVYLSHDGGEGHGYRLGDDFADFIERWSLLGCPGNEDWQMMPFLNDAVSGLDPHGENARTWRQWFGLNV